MAYVPQHNYRVKDNLQTGDPDKVIYGSDLQDDFDAIARDLSALNPGNAASQADLNKEIKDRQDGDSNLQRQINDINNNGGGGGGGASSWDGLTGKPTEFPPEAHTHQQSGVDGLETRLEAIEDSITSGGGFVDAPNDGKLYGRQSSDWAEVPDAGASEWADIENKPTEFPPSAHTHEIAEVNGLQDALDNAGGVTYTLPVALRSGNAQLPLTLDGKKLAVMTRGGELELPLAA